jgi:hypothetical protein
LISQQKYYEDPDKADASSAKSAGQIWCDMLDLSGFVPHSGVREALLAPTVDPALPDAVRSFFIFGRLEEKEKRKSSAPHGAELHPPQAAAERAALRSARSSARACGGSGSAGCGAELFIFRRLEEKEEEKRKKNSRPSLDRLHVLPFRSSILESDSAPIHGPGG